MGIAQSILWILKEKLKFKTKNEPRKDDCQVEHSIDDSQDEDGIDDSQEEYGIDDIKENDSTDDSQKADATDDFCNKKAESSLFYGTHETQVSEGGEADLHKHLVDCKKNPGHKQFVHVDDFNINHLPSGHQDNDLFDLIKATSDMTVRVAVTVTSTERPEFWPNTNQPYPFHDKRGSVDMKTGTGMVRYVNKWTQKDIENYHKETCHCHKCRHSNTPSKVRGVVWMFTARHVVFDDLEAGHTTCRFFYDRHDSPVVTLDGWTMVGANIDEDWCKLYCVTCDVDLLEKLDNIKGHWYDLWVKVTNKYKSYGDEDKFSFIVSHPHGCSKQISVGHWINRYKVDGDKTKCTYTTCTCPGTSGANVHSLWYYNWFYGRHVHSGVNSAGINFSGTGRNWF